MYDLYVAARKRSILKYAQTLLPLYDEGERLRLQFTAQCFQAEFPDLVGGVVLDAPPNPETWINQVKSAIEQIKRNNNSRPDFEDVAWIFGTWGDLTPAKAMGLDAVSLDDGLKASIEGNDCEAVKRLLSERDERLQTAFREKISQDIRVRAAADQALNLLEAAFPAHKVQGVLSLHTRGFCIDKGIKAMSTQALSVFRAFVLIDYVEAHTRGQGRDKTKEWQAVGKACKRLSDAVMPSGTIKDPFPSAEGLEGLLEGVRQSVQALSRWDESVMVQLTTSITEKIKHVFSEQLPMPFNPLEILKHHPGVDGTRTADEKQANWVGKALGADHILSTVIMFANMQKKQGVVRYVGDEAVKGVRKPRCIPGMAAVKFFSTYVFGQIKIKPVKPLDPEEKDAFSRLLSIGRSFLEQLKREQESVAQEKQRIVERELKLNKLASQFSLTPVSLPELRVGGATHAVTKSMVSTDDARLEARVALTLTQ